MRRLAVCVASVWAAQAQTSPATVEGQILDHITNAPVRKALVRLVPQRKAPHQFATSDENGRFSFMSVVPGSYGLFAQRIGYLDGDYQPPKRGPAGDWLELQAGQRLSVTLRLTPHSAISGRVVDEDGDPLEWVRIDVLKTVYSGGRRHWSGVGSANTDDRGRYRISGLAPRRYYLRVTPQESTQQLEERYIRCRFAY